MSALSMVPPKYRNVGSIESMATALDRAKVRNRQLAGAKKGVGMLESSAATAIGAAMCGVAMGRGWSPESIGAAGGGLAVLGLMTGQTALVHAANGVLAPVIAGMAMRASAPSNG